ncbi:hypothetical protein NDU88_004952 [Pleurodeles waltl]|uniref:Uncharacterized protein n=1 Tax=Pleurodeles waltl TaxID=8319 RepID=A0AAV7PMB5_PLEWA|nr:hypothetical protein NDU88_004952 [Pleurodeles waltl]
MRAPLNPTSRSERCLPKISCLGFDPKRHPYRSEFTAGKDNRPRSSLLEDICLTSKLELTLGEIINAATLLAFDLRKLKRPMKFWDKKPKR